MMRRIGIAVLLLVSSVLAAKPARAQRARREASCPAVDTTSAWFRGQREWMRLGSSGWSDSTLRRTLLGAPAFDRAAASGALLGFEFVDDVAAPAQAADSAIIAQLKALGAQRGSTWPTRSVVGSDGVLAVWSLARRDTTLARIALKRMMEAGPDESPPAAVALLEDRARLRVGRKQLYGTQLRVVSRAGGKGGKDVEPLPIEDPAHLDLRRDGAELPPLAQSLCAARSSASQSAASRASTDH